MFSEAPLSSVLAQVRERIEAYRGQGIGESNTKAVLIVPLLRALGWDVEDLAEVHLEYKRRPSDKPVDYALLIQSAPRLFVEAKALGENLDDRRWSSQIMGYATVAGVRWVVLTNGDEYRLYNSHASVPVEEKLFRSVRVSDPESRPEETLALLSKESVAELEGLWREDFVDRQLREAVDGLFQPEPDPGLVRVLRRRLPDLSPAQIRAGLERLRIEIARAAPGIIPKVPDEPKGGAAKKPVVGDGTPWSGITVGDLISEGILQPPLDLYRRYKGADLRARVERDGRVTFNAELIASLSVAGARARYTVLGDRPGKKRYPPTNGWLFWRYRDQAGEWKRMDDLRRQLWEKRGSPKG